jgi:hypothetical protein
MSDLTIFPADIAEMSVSQLAALPPEQKHEIDKNLDAAIDWLKKARTKFDAALDQCYGEQARAALRESGRDFGTAHISDGPLHLKFELPKKVSWNQKQLAEIAERIVASGEKVEGYLDIKLSVSESRYTNWPPALQQQFAAARTVDSGKPSFTLSLIRSNDHECNHSLSSSKRTPCASQVDDAGRTVVQRQPTSARRWTMGNPSSGDQVPRRSPRKGEVNSTPLAAHAARQPRQRVGPLRPDPRQHQGCRQAFQALGDQRGAARDPQDRQLRRPVRWRPCLHRPTTVSSAILLIGEAVAKVPGVKPGIAAAATLTCIQENTGHHHRGAAPRAAAANEPICALNATQLGKLLNRSAKATNQMLAAAACSSATTVTNGN